jgi:arylsulfatase A-like enzyme
MCLRPYNRAVAYSSGKNPSGPKRRVATVLLLSTVLCIAALLVSCGTSPDEARPNIVLIVIDALRADHLGCYGYGRPTSPVIDALAADGILFETAITQAPWTKASFSSFLTSFYTFQHGVVDWAGVMPESLVTLPEALADEGYSTVCVVNMIGMGGRFGVLKGFEKVSESGKSGRDAGGATADAIEYLREIPQPFFMLLHYFDVHQPYTPPPRYVDLINVDTDIDPFGRKSLWRRGKDGLPSRKAVDKTMLLYDGCIRYVDDSLARLFDFLEEEGMRDNTIIILTADHGEAFWEHGVDTHGSTVYDEVLKVPLIISWPATIAGAKSVASQVRLIDLFPTVLEMARASDACRGEGVSLLPLMEGRQVEAGEKLLPAHIAYADNGMVKPPRVKCLRTRDYKVIVNRETSEVEIYDLKKDPGETRNLAGGDLAGASALLTLMEHLPVEETASRPPARATLTDDEKKSLKALGYLQ